MINSVVEIKSDEEAYAIDGNIIYKILKPVDITPVPLVNKAIEGVCSVDGKIAVCINLNTLLNKEHKNFSKMITVLIDNEDITIHRDGIISIVDEIYDLMMIPCNCGYDDNNIVWDDIIDYFHKVSMYIKECMGKYTKGCVSFDNIDDLSFYVLAQTGFDDNLINQKLDMLQNEQAINQ